METTDHVVRITFRGDLDISRYDEVGKALQAAMDTDSRPVLIVLDETVHFADSFTLSEMLLFRRRLQSKFRRVAVHCVNASVYRTIALTNVAERLNVSMSEAEALKALGI
jgi:anti-anti-sigma factor